MTQKKYQFVAPKNEDAKSQTVLNILYDQTGGAYSKRILKRVLEHGGLQVNQEVERHASRKIQPGDQLYLDINSYRMQPAPRDLNASHVLYEDSVFMVIQKEAGWTSDPTDTGEQGVAKKCRRYFQGKGSGVYLGHRLDRETTGVLILLKQKKHAAWLQRSFTEHAIQKTYIALVAGIPEKHAGKIESDIGLIKKSRNQGRYGSVETGKGKRAITRYQVMQAYSHASLLKLTPGTGRTHQLRIHLAEMGHSILGDTLYGQRVYQTPVPNRLMLHAESLSLDHPETHKPVTWTAPVPGDFKFYQEQLDKQTKE